MSNSEQLLILHLLFKNTSLGISLEQKNLGELEAGGVEANDYTMGLPRLVLTSELALIYPIIVSPSKWLNLKGSWIICHIQGKIRLSCDLKLIAATQNFFLSNTIKEFLAISCCLFHTLFEHPFPLLSPSSVNKYYLQPIVSIRE